MQDRTGFDTTKHQVAANYSISDQVQSADTAPQSGFGVSWAQPPKSIFSRIKDRFIDMLFENSTNTARPIGISQISKKTFQAADPSQPGVFFRNNNRPYQDYRFIKLMDSSNPNE